MHCISQVDVDVDNINSLTMGWTNIYLLFSFYKFVKIYFMY